MDRRSRELVYIDGSDYAKDCEFLGQISYEYYVIVNVMNCKKLIKISKFTHLNSVPNRET